MKNKRLIEEQFPFTTVSEKSRRERTIGARPPIWGMHFWWARRPLIASRVVIAATCLPAEEGNLEELARLNRRNPYEEDPSPRLKVRVLDPFAGGGSIPFEALRLGCEAYAAEYNPVAYIILKATLEYPAKYGEKLLKDVEKWSLWLIEKVRQRVGRFYQEGVLGYRWGWQIRCESPRCGKYTFILKDWRISQRKHITLVPEGDSVAIAKGERAFDKTRVRGKGKCVYCDETIRNEYIKEASKKFLENQRKADPTGLGILVRLVRGNEDPLRLRMLTVAKRKEQLTLDGNIQTITGREYLVAREEDIELALKAEEALEASLQELLENDLVPIEEIAFYGGRYLAPVTYGFERWCQLFTPRQLLTIVAILKAIREAKAQLKNLHGNNYAKAVVTYLAMILDMHVNYNSIVTSWNSGIETIRDAVALLIQMSSDFVEVNPFEKTSGSLINITKNVIEGLEFAVRALREAGERVRVVYGSATELSYPIKFDIVVTDPPYEDDKPYAEVSDFWYVWLKRALGDLYPEAFSYRTLWEEGAFEEVSANPGRFYGQSHARKIAERHYEELLTASFRQIANVLRDDGLLVVYFAHSTTKAWSRLLRSLVNSGFVITATWPIHAEQRQRVIAVGREAIDSNIIVVARKGVHQDAGYLETLRPQLRREVSNFVRELIERYNIYNWADLLNCSMGPALKVLTRYKELRSVKGALTAEDILREVSNTVTMAVIDTLLEERVRLDDVSLLYLILRVSRLESRRTTEFPFDYVRRICLSLNMEIERGKEYYVLEENVEKKQKTFKLLVPPSTEVGALEDFLARRALKLGEPLKRKPAVVDAVHLAEVAYAKGGRRGLVEALKAVDEGLLEKAYVLIETLRNWLPRNEPERELLRPLSRELWNEVINEIRCAKEKARLDYFLRS